MAHYGRLDFWDERYTKDREPFDWYQRFNGIQETMNKFIPSKNSKILNAGCGNSSKNLNKGIGLSEDMMEDGYTSIDNIDYSKVVIETMIEKCKEKSGLKCIV